MPVTAPPSPRTAPSAHAGRGGVSDGPVAAQYRRFLFATASVLYVGAAAELALVGHYHGWTQVIPLVLIALALVALLWLRRGGAGRRTLGAVRVTSALVVVGSVVGVGLHVKGNLEFEREIHPDAPLMGALWEAAQGASPLLAPGALALAGVLAAAATWRHPALAHDEG